MYVLYIILREKKKERRRYARTRKTIAQKINTENYKIFIK